MGCGRRESERKKWHREANMIGHRWLTTYEGNYDFPCSYFAVDTVYHPRVNDVLRRAKPEEVYLVT